MKSQRLILRQSSGQEVKDQKFKSKLKTFYFLIVFLTFDFLFLNSAKVAAADLSLGISPPITQIQIAPPDSIVTPITVYNYNDETVTLKILLKSFTAGKARHRTVPGKGELDEVVYESGKNPLVFDKIKVRDNDEVIENVIIAPRQNKTLNLYIDIPKSESASDYYFSIIFISENNPRESLNQSRILAGIATNVLLSIGKETKPKAKIVEFLGSDMLSKEPAHFTIKLKNQGKHFITPQGTISIKNIFGKTIGQVKPSPVNILAGKTRLQKVSWQKGFMLGPYTATLTVNVSDFGPTLTKSFTFFVFPLWTFIGLTATVTIFFLIKNRLRKYRNKNL